MAENTTIARPYAEAIFSLAKEAANFKTWSDTLQLAAAVASDETMQRLIGDTNIQKAQLAQLFIDICADKLNDHGKNMVKVLVENKRLAILPEIMQQYENLRAEAEKTLEAEVISAFEVSDAQKKHIAEKLKARLGREVTLSCSIDKTLLGGVVIKAGDMVIDGSTIGQINKLSVELAG
jgi:F-type H+-transporting ATPase subunit delta